MDTMEGWKDSFNRNGVKAMQVGGNTFDVTNGGEYYMRVERNRRL